MPCCPYAIYLLTAIVPTQPLATGLCNQTLLTHLNYALAITIS